MAKRIPKAQHTWAALAGQGLPPPRAKPQQREAAEQRALWQWVQTQPWADCWYHIPQERWSQREAWRLKSEGVRRGLPDNLLILARGGYCSAVSELKAPKPYGKAPTGDQVRVIAQMTAAGYCVEVHYGWDEAREFFEAYVRGELMKP